MTTNKLGNPLNNTLENRLPDILNVVSVFMVKEIKLTESIIETAAGDFKIRYSTGVGLSTINYVPGAGITTIKKCFDDFKHLKHKKIVLLHFEYGHYIDKEDTECYFELPVMLPEKTRF